MLVNTPQGKQAEDLLLYLNSKRCDGKLSSSNLPNTILPPLDNRPKPTHELDAKIIAGNGYFTKWRCMGFSFRDICELAKVECQRQHPDIENIRSTGCVSGNAEKVLRTIKGSSVTKAQGRDIVWAEVSKQRAGMGEKVPFTNDIDPTFYEAWSGDHHKTPKDSLNVLLHALNVTDRKMVIKNGERKGKGPIKQQSINPNGFEKIRRVLNSEQWRSAGAEHSADKHVLTITFPSDELSLPAAEFIVKHAYAGGRTPMHATCHLDMARNETTLSLSEETLEYFRSIHFPDNIAKTEQSMGVGFER